MREVIRAANIHRPVHEKSIAELAFMGAAAAEFPHVSLTLREPEYMWATILSSSRTGGDLLRKPKKKIEGIVYPIPTSGREPLTLPVRDVTFMGCKEGLSWLALLLRDDEGVFARETSAYWQRLSRTRGSRPFENIPHVSLARVAIDDQDDRLLRWVDRRRPTAIQLEPISTLPSVLPPKPYEPVRSVPKPFTDPIRVVPTVAQSVDAIPAMLRFTPKFEG